MKIFIFIAGILLTMVLAMGYFIFTWGGPDAAAYDDPNLKYRHMAREMISSIITYNEINAAFPTTLRELQNEFDGDSFLKWADKRHIDESDVKYIKPKNSNLKDPVVVINGVCGYIDGSVK